MGAPNDCFSLAVVEEMSEAHVVPGQDQLLILSIPDGECPLPC